VPDGRGALEDRLTDPSGVDRDLPLEQVREAAERIRGLVRRTPLLSSRAAAAEIERSQGIRIGGAALPGDRALAGPRLLLKAEHLQLTGSFKPRGVLNRVALLSAGERERGVITISAGNHAQAVAYAAASAGIPATVVMPASASRAKVAAAAAYGAQIVLHGVDLGETFRHMEALRDERGLFYLPPFDDPAVIAGQGTAGLEILEDLPEVDVVVVGVGGGGLISGIAAAVKQQRATVRVYGVEPESSDAMTRGLAAGRPVPVQPASIADGLGAPFAGEWTIPLVRRYVDDLVLIDDATIAAGMRFGLERLKQLLEPAGAAALAALLAGRIPVRDGELVCVVLSGGNVDLDRLPGMLALAQAAEA
jgi:threonine dehydratase